MKLVAPGVYLLRGFPPHGINAYFADGMLVDAGTRFHRLPILSQLRSYMVVAHVLTHAHPDHQGASHAVCAALDLPFDLDALVAHPVWLSVAVLGINLLVVWVLGRDLYARHRERA